MRLSIDVCLYVFVILMKTSNTFEFNGLICIRHILCPGTAEHFHVSFLLVRVKHAFVHFRR